MKTLIPLLILLLVPVSALSKTKVAMLISGYGNNGDVSLSYDLEELAQSYMILINNGIEVDIISPEGGAVPVHNKKDQIPHIQQFKKLALKSLEQTTSSKQALTKEYQAIMIIGGDGAMFDLPFHKETQAFIQQFAAENKPIAAVCHGPAALVDIKNLDGSLYVANKRVNSFTKIEDHAFKKEHVTSYPFIVQTKLEEQGADFVSSAPMMPFVVQDGNLITAQNPMSVPSATEALLLKLNKVPNSRELFKDEATFQLISQAKSQGAVLIDVALTKAKESYDIQYLALYGIYAYKLATTPENKLTELRIMEQIGKHFSHPIYSATLVNAYFEQGFVDKAKKEKHHLVSTFPDFELPEKIKSI